MRDWLIDILGALFIFGMFFLFANFLFSAIAEGAEEAPTVNFELMNDTLSQSIICFHNLDPDAKIPHICYYSTRTNIPLPDFPFHLEIRVWTDPKETLTDVIRILRILSKGKEK